MATTDNDCSDGFCSIHCPQWCYFLFFPPPSPSSSSSLFFSPLNIAIIGTVLSFIILLSYYTLISKYCNSHSFHSHPSIQQNGASRSNGIDEILINKIAVFKYRKADGVIELTDCSVCLGEFTEEESLRLLPKCNHAFHLQCALTLGSSRIQAALFAELMCCRRAAKLLLFLPSRSRSRSRRWLWL